MTAAAGAVQVRPASPADAAAVVAIEAAAFAHPPERFDARKIGYLLRSPRVAAFVAESTDTGVFAWAAGFAWTRGPVPWGRVYALAVYPSAQRRRVGPKLLSAVIDVLRARGAARVFLEVRADNAAAVRLYRKFGFVACRKLPDYYGKGLHADRMVQDAPPGEPGG
jgi:ribosomal protein S18 acetylase RimI-like enzyme